MIGLWMALAWAGPGDSLEQIMADPDWMGNQPRSAFWAADGRSVVFSRKQVGSELADLVAVGLDGVEEPLAEADWASVGGRGVIDRAGRRRLSLRHGDVFLEDLRSGRVRQLTGTAASERAPMFLTDRGRVAWRVGNTWRVAEVDSGLVVDATALRLEDEPDEEDEDEGFLDAQQERLFFRLSEMERADKERRDRERSLRAVDEGRAPPRVYLGDEREIEQTQLSPDGAWLFVVLSKEDAKEGRADDMPKYVTMDGYVETEEVREKVGTGALAFHELLLVNREEGSVHPLDLGSLPRLAEAAEQGAMDDDPPALRPLWVARTAWSPEGSLALTLDSSDNKDRWIVRVEAGKEPSLELVHDEHDDAWITWTDGGMGWLADGKTLWFTSEHTGFNHLYVQGESGPVALTEGRWEVDTPVADRSGGIWFNANATDPGVWDVHRVEPGSHPVQVTAVGGTNRFQLSPNERSLLLTHSERDQPPELWVQPARAGAAARRLTKSTTEAFEAEDWVVPTLVDVPSSHVDQPIRARHYAPVGEPNGAAILFIHGAGYMQDAHEGWSYYFREFMFHTLLARRGYHVLDLDYRASAGYGRAWRTAIYRDMGRPEVEDLRDGVEWLVAKHGIDANRVGAYGGSYGGFLTLMALFTDAELFACGAALRPVTDWAHYNHGYTSAILDTPEEVPEVYRATSPIEHAEGLTKPLLVAHGMLDDNVLVSDTVRLTQRLIELRKTDWEVALYPMERHGFRGPESWLDEYRRIDALFRRHLEGE
jgi:dipeptidyl aminopeptidase/acylaminoacyl peptidase